MERAKIYRLNRQRPPSASPATPTASQHYHRRNPSFRKRIVKEGFRSGIGERHRAILPADIWIPPPRGAALSESNLDKVWLVNGCCGRFCSSQIAGSRITRRK